jgi:hypothetical protein
VRPEHFHGGWLDTIEAGHDERGTNAPQQLSLREDWILRGWFDM